MADPIVLTTIAIIIITIESQLKIIEKQKKNY